MKLLKRESSKREQSDSSEDENEYNSKVTHLAVFPIRQVVPNREEEADDSTFLKIKTLLTCPICLELFSEPVYIKDCSHRFCKECIEKSIRVGKKKSCPACRKTLGTKRQTRTDDNVLDIIFKIFENVKEYTNKVDEEEKKLVKNWGIDHQIYNTTKRSRQKSEKLELSSSASKGRLLQNSNSTTDIKDENNMSASKIKKKRKLNDETKKEKNTIKLINPDITDQKMREAEELTLTEDEDTLEGLKYLETVSSEIMNLECIITFQVLKKPGEVLLKQIEKKVFRTGSEFRLSDVAAIICRKLNINEKKFKDYIDLYIKKNEEYIKLEKSMYLKEVNTKYWDFYGDLVLYDLEDFFPPMLSNNTLSDGKDRPLYYTFDFDKLI